MLDVFIKTLISYYTCIGIYLFFMFILYNLLLKGALTSKPYAFKIRAWELSSLETVDSNDHFYSSIYVQYKNSKIIRVLPIKKKNFYFYNFGCISFQL